MRGGSACIPTLCQGLSPQKGRLKIDIHLIVWGGNNFCLWRLLEHLASTVFCGKLIYSSQTRSFFGEDEFVSETGLSPIGPAFFALSVDEAVWGVKPELNVWYFDDATLGDYPERIHDYLVVLLERLRAIGLEVNGSKYELCNKVMRSVFSQAVGRCFRGSGEAIPTQPLTLIWGNFI